LQHFVAARIEQSYGIGKSMANLLYIGKGHNLAFLPEVARSESSPSGLRYGHASICGDE
jgi:hypothetical protein